jgi:hypothetical protein
MTSPWTSYKFSFSFPAVIQIQHLMKGRVSFKQMVPSGDVVITIGVVHSAAEEHPIAMFSRNKEHWMRGVENMSTYERGNLTLIRI